MNNNGSGIVICNAGRGFNDTHISALAVSLYGVFDVVSKLKYASMCLLCASQGKVSPLGTTRLLDASCCATLLRRTCRHVRPQTISGPSVEIMLCVRNQSEPRSLSYRFVYYYLLTKTLKRIDITYSRCVLSYVSPRGVLSLARNIILTASDDRSQYQNSYFR